MMGKNHVRTNAAVVLAASACFAAGMEKPGALASVCEGAVSLLYPSGVTLGVENGLTSSTPIFLFGALFMLWVGSLLPDIDSPKSRFGKKLHLPFKHRTWTHSVWPVLFLAFLGCFVVWFRWLLAGYLLHIIGDSFSAAGICFFYPFQKYKEFSSGAFVAPKHVVKLYRAGEKSETWFAWSVVCVCILLCLICHSGFSVLWNWIRF